MACCAFAIFLLTQLFAPFRALARRLGIAPQWRPDAAVEWRPGTVMPRRQTPKWLRMALGLVALDVALAGLVGVAAASTAGAAQEAKTNTALERAIHDSLCGSFGWRN